MYMVRRLRLRTVGAFVASGVPCWLRRMLCKSLEPKPSIRVHKLQQVEQFFAIPSVAGASTSTTTAAASAASASSPEALFSLERLCSGFGVEYIINEHPNT